MARKQKSPSPDGGEDGATFEVDKIIAHKMGFDEKDRVTYTYRIRWKGYQPDEDTWEPTSSLEGGAGSVLEQYQKKKEAKGEMFFPEGTKRSLMKSLKRHYGRTSVLDGSANNTTNGKPSSSSSRSRRAAPAADDEEEEDEQEEYVEEEEEEEEQRVSKPRKSSGSSSRKQREEEEERERQQQQEAEEAARAERKRKKRESQAAAAAAAAAEEAEERPKKVRRDKSDSPLPSLPAPLSSRRENDSKKPSSTASRRSEDKDATAASTKSKRTYITQSEEEDAFEIEQIKKSPSKEKKVDEPVAAATAAATATETDSQSRKKASEEPLVKSAISGSAAETVPSHTTTSTVPSAAAGAVDGDAASSQGELKDNAEEMLHGSTIHRKAATWEELVTVDSLEQESNVDYKWHVTWADGIGQEWIPNPVARRKFPQKLLDFYQDHLKFKTTVDEDPEDGAVNGDEGAMEQD